MRQAAFHDGPNGHQPSRQLRSQRTQGIERGARANPVASKTEVINTENGKYLVESNDNGYTITKGDETVQFINEGGVWYVNQGDQKVEMFHYVDENHICLNMGETTKIVELSRDGVDSFRAEMAN